MVYIGVKIKADITRTCNPKLQPPACSDTNYDWHYLSLLSLSLNKNCRAALIDAIFFSSDHEKLSHSLIGPKFRLTQNLLLCPNGPNVVPQVRNWAEPMYKGTRKKMKTAVPSFAKHSGFFDFQEPWLTFKPESYAMDFSRPDVNTHGLHTAVLMASHEKWYNTMSYESTKKFASGK